MAQKHFIFYYQHWRQRWTSKPVNFQKELQTNDTNEVCLVYNKRDLMSFRLMLSKTGWKSGSLSLSYSSCYHQIWKDLEVKKHDFKQPYFFV